MKALMKKEPDVGLWMENVPEPEIGPDDLLVKIKKMAICGTDIHIYNWNSWAQKTIHTPMIIGHEFVGEIVDVGSAVKGWSVGERISGEGHITCGTCRSCRTGKPHLCLNARGIGVNRDGCFAEYLSIPASNAWRVPLSISDEEAAIFDPFGNATHTALSFELIGEDVLITGAGPIGCLASAICRYAGAKRVVITDLNPWRLELAQKLGATHTINIKNDSIADFVKREKIPGFSVGLEMSGSGEALESMLEAMYPGGRIALLGLLEPETKVDWDHIIFKGLHLKGIYGREIFNTWYKMEAMLINGLPISSVITNRYSFDDFQEGFDMMLSGKSGKVILNIE
jgi:threonine 3-dehydrogenase